MIYVNDALKKEQTEQRITKLETGETVVTSKEDKKIARENLDQKEKADLDKLKSEMRKDNGGKGDTKRIDAPPPDVSATLMTSIRTRRRLGFEERSQEKGR